MEKMTNSAGPNNRAWGEFAGASTYGPNEEVVRAKSLPHIAPDEQLSTYCIGAIGALTELQARVYFDLCNFDKKFEIFVARELAEFIENFDSTRDGLWLSKRGQKIVGAIAIDGADRDGVGARLRFLIVDPDYEGQGIGRLLMQTAIDFCRSKSMNHIYLMTTPRLDRARILYERFGFTLTNEVQSDWWGVDHIHQRFDLTLT